LHIVAARSRKAALVVVIVGAIAILFVVGFIVKQSQVNQSANETGTPTASVSAPLATQQTGIPVEVQSYLTYLKSVESDRTNLRGGLPAATASLASAGGPPTVAQPPVPPAGTTPPGPLPGNPSQATGGETAAPAPAPTPSAPIGRPAPAASAEFAAYAKKWQDMIDRFKQQSPPRDCKDLDDDYFRLMTDYAQMLQQLAALPSPTVDDINKTEQQFQSQIRSDGLVADKALKTVADQYSMAKPFDISPDLVPTPP
jgi:hypothetical protein